MPVIDNRGVMVGILSEADLIRHTDGMARTEVSDNERAAKAMAETRSKCVADVKTKEVVTATEDATLRDIADLMLKHGIKRVPILRDRSVVGIVGRVDLLQALISLGPHVYVQRAAAAHTADEDPRSAVTTALQGQNWSQARRSDARRPVGREPHACRATAGPARPLTGGAMYFARSITVATLLAAASLGACHSQHTIEGTSSQYMNVAGKRVKANLSPSDVPGEFDLLIVRDAMVINPDPESERERGRDAATRVMRDVCGVKGLSPQVIGERLVQQLNYYVRFRCV
jgi:hypothetical protein